MASAGAVRSCAGAGCGGDAVMPASLRSLFHESQCSSHEKKAGSVIMIIVYSSFYTFALSGIFFENSA